MGVEVRFRFHYDDKGPHGDQDVKVRVPGEVAEYDVGYADRLVSSGVASLVDPRDADALPPVTPPEPPASADETDPPVSTRPELPKPRKR